MACNENKADYAEKNNGAASFKSSKFTIRKKYD